MGAWPDREIAAIADRQGANIAHAQLRGLGVPAKTITATVRRGRLHRVHTGVYSLVPRRARPRWAAEHAALLACGPAAVLSHATAARIHGLRLPGSRPGHVTDVNVTVPRDGPGRGRPGIHAHRSADLPQAETTRRDGLRVTSVARTIVDLSAIADPRALEPLVDQALRQTSAAKLREAVDRHPARRGMRALRAVLDPSRPSADAWSRTEARLRRMLVQAGLPAPESNVAIASLVPDLLWREQRVVVEYDSDAYHFGPAGHRRTWERHEVLQAQGFDVIHVTWDDLRARRGRVLVRIAVALARAGWAPG